MWVLKHIIGGLRFKLPRKERGTPRDRGRNTGYPLKVIRAVNQGLGQTFWSAVKGRENGPHRTGSSPRKTSRRRGLVSPEPRVGLIEREIFPCGGGWLKQLKGVHQGEKVVKGGTVPPQDLLTEMREAAGGKKSSKDAYTNQTKNDRSGTGKASGL